MPGVFLEAIPSLDPGSLERIQDPGIRLQERVPGDGDPFAPLQGAARSPLSQTLSMGFRDRRLSYLRITEGLWGGHASFALPGPAQTTLFALSPPRRRLPKNLLLKSVVVSPAWRPLAAPRSPGLLQRKENPRNFEGRDTNYRGHARRIKANCSILPLQRCPSHRL